MKILLDGHTIGNKRTGIERYWHNLSKSMIAMSSGDHDFYLYGSKERNSSQFLEDSCTYSPMLNSGLFRLTYGFGRAVERFKPDLLHVGNFTPLVKSVPIVNTVYDLCFRNCPKTYSLKNMTAFNFFFKKSIANSDAIICISEKVKNDLIKYYRVDASKIVAIHLAADPVFRYIEDRKRVIDYLSKEFNLTRDYFLVVGDIDKRKNPSSILKAFETFAHFNSSIDLVFVGANRLGDGMMREFKGASCFNRIRMLGYVSDEELNYLYNGTRALIFNSLDEGFGLPLVEAMSCRAPIICSDIDVFREIVDGAALFVKDTAGLVDSMRQISAKEPNSGFVSDRAKEMAEKYTWDKTAEKTLAVYETVLAKTYQSSTQSIA